MTEAPEPRVTPEREAQLRKDAERWRDVLSPDQFAGSAPEAMLDLLALLDAERAKVAELEKEIDVRKAASARASRFGWPEGWPS